MRKGWNKHPLSKTILQLDLYRREFEDRTKGELYVDGHYLCDTLEDVNRDLNRDGDLNDEGEKKVYGETCIPYGTYKVVLSYSPKFKRVMPELLDVPHFTGIRIHSGNTTEDTLGCILVGKHMSNDSFLHSRDNYNILFATLEEAVKNKEEIWITIKPFEV